jgi:hypothetical protein
MPVSAQSATSVDVPVGGDWLISVQVTDADGYPIEQAPVVTVTKPDGSTATPTVAAAIRRPCRTCTTYGYDCWHGSTSGVYRAVYEPTTAGRHLAVAAAAGYGAATFVAFVGALTTSAGMPDIADVDDYLAPHSWTDTQLQQALDAEAAAQRAVCDVPAEYGADLREALMRRVAVNLAKRRIPLAVLQGDAEAGTPASFVPGSDPEIRRLERPHLKLPTIA